MVQGHEIQKTAEPEGKRWVIVCGRVSQTAIELLKPTRVEFSTPKLTGEFFEQDNVRSTVIGVIGKAVKKARERYKQTPRNDHQKAPIKRPADSSRGHR